MAPLQGQGLRKSYFVSISYAGGIRTDHAAGSEHKAWHPLASALPPVGRSAPPRDLLIPKGHACKNPTGHVSIRQQLSTSSHDATDGLQR